MIREMPYKERDKQFYTKIGKLNHVYIKTEKLHFTSLAQFKR